MLAGELQLPDPQDLGAFGFDDVDEEALFLFEDSGQEMSAKVELPHACLLNLPAYLAKPFDYHTAPVPVLTCSGCNCNLTRHVSMTYACLE